MKTDNVIDFVEIRKDKKNRNTNTKYSFKGEAPVVDITERRQEIIADERRDVKRTLLTGFIGAFVVVPGQGLLKVAIHDISETGIAFDCEYDFGKFHLGEEVAMRVYLNQTTYFPFVVQVQNIRDIEEEVVHRHGAQFTEDSVNSQALNYFVKFVETVSSVLETDKGDIMVSNLKV